MQPNTDRPGLYSLARARLSPRAVSPIPYSIPGLLRQRHSPHLTRRSLGLGSDSAYNSLADLNTATGSQAPLPGPDESAREGTAELPSPGSSSGETYLNHNYRLGQLELRLKRLEGELKSGSGVESSGNLDAWRLRRRRLGAAPALSGSNSSLGSGLDETPTSPAPFRTNPLFALPQSTPLPKEPTTLSRSYHGAITDDEEDLGGLESDTTFQGQVSVLLSGKEQEISRLKGRLERSEAELASSKSAAVVAASRAAEEAEEARKLIGSLRKRAEEMEQECMGWSSTVSALRAEVEEERAAAAAAREELEAAKANLLDDTPEPIWPPLVRLEALESQLAEREEQVASLKRRLAEVESAAAFPIVNLGSAPRDDLAREVYSTRVGVAALGESARALGAGCVPELDALLGLPSEEPSGGDGSAASEVAALRAEVEELADWLRSKSVDAVVEDASSSCRVS